jgi:hypothetical protein
MGYFKQPLRRGDARLAKRSANDLAHNVDFGPWRRCGPSFRVSTDQFLRFVVERSRDRTVGVFRSSCLLDAGCDFPPAARSAARELFRWFRRNLPVPRRLPMTAVCWFRADASEQLGRVRELVEVYRCIGATVLMQATATPGRIVYRDEHQVAAVPYRDRRTSVTAV